MESESTTIIPHSGSDGLIEHQH